MSRPVALAGLLILSQFATSCVTTVDGSWVSGRVHDVTATDIRAAVSVSRMAPKDGLGGRIARRSKDERPRQIEIVNHDEINVYWDERKAVNGSHDIVKRIRGKWQHTSETLELRDPIPYNPI